MCEKNTVYWFYFTRCLGFTSFIFQTLTKQFGTDIHLIFFFFLRPTAPGDDWRTSTQRQTVSRKAPKSSWHSPRSSHTESRCWSPVSQLLIWFYLTPGKCLSNSGHKANTDSKAWWLAACSHTKWIKRSVEWATDLHQLQTLSLSLFFSLFHTHAHKVYVLCVQTLAIHSTLLLLGGLQYRWRACPSHWRRIIYTHTRTTGETCYSLRNSQETAWKL